MKIQELASKPELIEIALEDEDILKNYGEAVTFWTYDIVSLTTYFDFFNARTKSEYDALDGIIKKLILDERGQPVIKEGYDLPIDIAAAAINKIGEILGKSQSKTSTQTIGDVQK